VNLDFLADESVDVNMQNPFPNGIRLIAEDVERIKSIMGSKMNANLEMQLAMTAQLFSLDILITYQ
jgi:hypothetical protein